jgi:hypothetical protein
VALLCYAVPLFEHNAHTSLYLLHALPQARTDEDPGHDGKYDG